MFDVIGGESLEFWVSLKDGKGYIMVCIYIYPPNGDFDGEDYHNHSLTIKFAAFP